MNSDQMSQPTQPPTEQNDLSTASCRARVSPALDDKWQSSALNIELDLNAVVKSCVDSLHE